MTRLFPIVVFLIIGLSPSWTLAARPLGLFEGVSADGVISGWALDPDSPSTAIEVHIFMDGRAGIGGKLVGTTRATIPREDVGNHGFRFELPPSARDGVLHSYRVYAMDTSGNESDNLLLPGSPQDAILRSTIVRMSNGTIQVGIEPRCGGTIAEFVFAGTNLVNNFDCTGRQIQVALYDGNSNYDHCAACTGVWGWNPVQGGDRHGAGSVVLEQTASTDSIYIKTRPYEWSPDMYGGGPGRPILSDVLIEQWLSFVEGAPYALKMRSRITHLGTDNHSLALQEFPASYVNLGFDQLVYYSGKSPWTGSPVTTTTVQTRTKYNTAEKWAAFVDKQNNGLTVYVPEQYPYLTGARFSDSGGANYMTPFVPFTLSAGSILDGEIYLIAGDYNAARQLIYRWRSNTPDRDVLPPYGFLDTPGSGQVLKGLVTISGWAFDDGVLSRIEVLVDGAIAGNAVRNRPRADVVAAFPNAPPNTGYSYMLNTRRLKNGKYVISIRAIDAVGNRSILIKPITVFVNN